MNTNRIVPAGVAIALAASTILFGCRSEGDASAIGEMASNTPTFHASPPDSPQSSARTTPDYVSTTIDARPAALVNGTPVRWGELKNRLNEAAGGEVLEAVILQQVLATHLDQRDMAVTDSDVAAEQRLLLDSLSTDPDTAIRLLQEMKKRRNLGPERYDALLWRNAALRKLVEPDVLVNDAAINVMYDLQHGPRRQARIITTATLQDANRALQRINAGEHFGDVAIDISTDASASRGGLLEPITRTDPAYPDALRATLWSLGTGGISQPVLLESGYAIIRNERDIPGDGTDPKAVRDDMWRLARLNAERLAMIQLARRLVRETSVTVYDRALRDAWQGHIRQRN